MGGEFDLICIYLIKNGDTSKTILKKQFFTVNIYEITLNFPFLKSF